MKFAKRTQIENSQNPMIPREIRAMAKMKRKNEPILEPFKESAAVYQPPEGTKNGTAILAVFDFCRVHFLRKPQ